MKQWKQAITILAVSTMVFSASLSNARAGEPSQQETTRFIEKMFTHKGAWWERGNYGGAILSINFQHCRMKTFTKRYRIALSFENISVVRLFSKGNSVGLQGKVLEYERGKRLPFINSAVYFGFASRSNAKRAFQAMKYLQALCDNSRNDPF